MKDSGKFLHKTISLQGRQYQIQERIGEGSHSTVWLVRERFYPHQELTVKIARETQGIARERVENEIWFLNEIRHPNIPEFLGQGDLDGHLWVAMPVFQSLSIAASVRGKFHKIPVSDIRSEGYPRLASKVPLEQREKMAAAVLGDIGKVISYIAGTGIVHADISPGNIMEKRGSVVQKQYILTDWGASALIHRYPQDSFGSLHFTAPERLFGQVSHKSDLYSLGITCYYILTGTIPYAGQTGELYYLSVVDRDGAAPSDQAPGIFSPLDKLIRDMIRHKSEDRPEPEDVCRRIDKVYVSLQ